MISRLRTRLFGLHFQYSNPLDKHRAQVLLYLNIVLLGITLASITTLQIPEVFRSGKLDLTGLASSLIVIVAAAASYQFIQNGRLQVAIWVILGAILLGTLTAILFSGKDATPSVSTPLIIFVTVPIVVAGVLTGWRGLIGVSALVLLVTAVSAIAQSSTGTPVMVAPQESAFTGFVAIGLAVVSIVIVLVVFLGRLQEISARSFEISDERYWINQLGLHLATIKREPELLSTALTQIRRNFSQRLIEIYLVNDDGNFNNIAGSGQRRITIRSIDTNIVAEAARSRTLLSTSIQANQSHRTHMAASTSYAIAVPMIMNTDVLGVLDIQSTIPFTENDLVTFQQLANQITLALQYVRANAELELRVDDHEKTIRRLQTQVQEYSIRQRQSVAEVWGGYIAGRGRKAIGYNLDGTALEPVQATDLPSSISHTLTSGQLEVITQGSEQIINVPIRFRDTNLGAMSFAVPADQPISERQIEVATTVAERLAMALENTRLFEQSQSQALRERKASEVAAALIGATDVRVVLNLAAEQFKDALGAVNTRIYIQPESLMEPLAQMQQEK